MRTYVRQSSGLIVPATRKLAVAASLTFISSDVFDNNASNVVNNGTPGTNTDAALGGVAKAWGGVSPGSNFFAYRSGIAGARYLEMATTTAGDTTINKVYIDAGVADYHVEAVMKTLPGAAGGVGKAGILARSSGNSDGYFLGVDNTTGNVVLWKRTGGFGGSWTVLATYTPVPAIAAGGKIRLWVKGSTLKSYWNDTLLGTITDTWNTTIQLGGVFSNTTGTAAQFDNVCWYVG